MTRPTARRKVVQALAIKRSTFLACEPPRGVCKTLMGWQSFNAVVPLNVQTTAGSALNERLLKYTHAFFGDVTCLSLLICTLNQQRFPDVAFNCFSRASGSSSPDPRKWRKNTAFCIAVTEIPQGHISTCYPTSHVPFQRLVPLVAKRGF